LSFIIDSTQTPKYSVWWLRVIYQSRESRDDQTMQDVVKSSIALQIEQEEAVQSTQV